ncbi:phosphoglycolate phosphatase [Butyrivibrio hungatei DSM 14810]|uniref:Phosphoglycolate phosphatase n=1 Tax=Butyrivibrio hungatei DSM 14810 TaxID=1121132 RepID=A0A1M7SIK7_9FIRM|nr:DHH family phosphoesterase [Butyrivibrio hungatei]SHN58326.1 phosphoglycolate phosphatase [Butyrivibrio hungatei DSM 14810]
MKLRDLLAFNDIVIQCHDNPDADALASGYGLYLYFKDQGKNIRFIYRGNNRIKKSNLMIMVDELQIPVEYAPSFDEEVELLLTVDCQYGQRNVTMTRAQTIAVIDHHQKTVELPDLSEVRSSVGSASTIVWDMLMDEGYEIDMKLSTALYYGLYCDTNKFSEVSHPLDRDMMDELVVNRSLIVKMRNSNMSLDELKITGKAILGYEFFAKKKYLIIESEPCDPNILGVMSDFSLETEGVDVCLAYYVGKDEIKFSVRSCAKEVHANELAFFLAEGVGGGGGHIYKAGGNMRPELVAGKQTQIQGSFQDGAEWYIKHRMEEYFDSYDVIIARNTLLDTSSMDRYVKIPCKRGCAKLTDIFPENTRVSIRTLEGDIDITVNDQLYVMIGIEGEIYPIDARKLKRSYSLANEEYDVDLEYNPTIKDCASGEKKQILAYARTIIPRDDHSVIFASQIKKTVKIFTMWDEEKYYLGNPGDYIACREDDLHDIYIIKERLFDQLYTRKK